LAGHPFICQRMAKASALLGQTGSGVGSLGNAELFFHAETQVENYLQVAKFARVCPDAPLFIPDSFPIVFWIEYCIGSRRAV
jgi:hypothetical protein